MARRLTVSDNQDVQKVVARAIKRFGRQHQFNIVVEECSEAIAVIMQANRGRASWLDLIDEAADLIIVAETLRQLAGGQQVDEQVANKLNRLAHRTHTGVDTEQG
jgi:hypothetical protein